MFIMPPIMFALANSLKHSNDNDDVVGKKTWTLSVRRNAILDNNNNNNNNNNNKSEREILIIDREQTVNGVMTDQFHVDK